MSNLSRNGTNQPPRSMLFASQLHDLKNSLPWNVKRREQQAIRTIMEQKRRVYDNGRAIADSQTIVEKTEQLPVFREAQTVLLYYPIRNEVDLRPLLEKYKDSKTMLLPVTHRKSIEIRPYTGADCLKEGYAHIPEPQTEAYTGKVDLILVPGVAFDRKGHRIGRGGGYYDRFLKKHKKACKLGIGYDFQLKHRDLPQTRHDQPLDGVITPQETIVL